MDKPVILTGVRSNAELTLGNLLGAILPVVRLQQKHAGDYRFNIFIPDLHSLTTPTEYNQLYDSTLRNLRMFSAAGLDVHDPDTLIYRQSYITAHSELAWLMDCFVYYGELARMTQFKDKKDSQDNVSGALFNYPALMAADILLYDAKYVPVGEDQCQHLELTRDVAMRMNHLFGDLFVVPEPWAKQLAFIGGTAGARIRSLKYPQFKMSKSVSDPAGTILLTDNPAAAKQKVLGATTDSLGVIDLNFKTQPGVSNLLQIIGAIEDRPVDEVAAEWKGKSSYVQLKQTAADLVEHCLGDFQAKLEIIANQELLAALVRDEASARAIAQAKLEAVQKAVGLRPNNAS